MGHIVLLALATDIQGVIFVFFAEAHFLHEAGGGVAEMDGDGEGGDAGVAQGGVGVGEAAVDARALGGEGEGDGGVGEVDAGFRHAELFRRRVGRHAEREEAVVGEPDVFRRDHDQPPRDVERRFPGLEHAREVVERGGRVGAAHGFVEGGNGVVFGK